MLTQLPRTGAAAAVAGGYVGLVEKVEYIDRLKELVVGERASIEATKREMEREQQEQAEERRRRDTDGSA